VLIYTGVHRGCYLGDERHPLTYVGRRRFQHGPLNQIWYLFHVTVYPYRDRPLPQWPYSLSINSLISVYAVILKAAILLILAQGKAFKLVAYRTGTHLLLGLGHLKWSWFKHPRPLADLGTYDDASRWSLGAVSLLWTLRGRLAIGSLHHIYRLSRSY
jgi:hypothetical protein